MPRAAVIALLVAGGLLAVALLAAAFVVAAGSEESEPSANASTRQPELPLAEDGGALMVARRNGRVLVGLAVVPGGRIQAVAVEGEEAVPESELTFTVDGRPVTPSACGQACWELDVQQARELVVNAPESVRFQLPAVLPPSGAPLFAAVTRTMDALRAYRYREDLTAGAGPVTRSTWEAQVPGRMRVTGAGFRFVIVGTSRWDYRAGRWERSPHPGVDLPTYMWDGAGNARVLGRAGGTVVLSVFDREPRPAWFRLTVDAGNRVVDAEMLSPSHFMRQRFRDFDAPLRIESPR